LRPSWISRRSASEIARNRRCAEIYSEDSMGRYTVDYSKFHDRIDLSPK
jgi:hypothetical protein